MDSGDDDEDDDESGSGSGQGGDDESGSGDDSQAESGSGSEEVESGDEDDDDDGDDSKEWEEYCYICNDGGNMLCCEEKACTQVAHAACAGLKTAPKGEWRCRDCAAKLAQKKQASRTATTLSNGRAAAKNNSSRGAHVPTRTSSRRAGSRR